MASSARGVCAFVDFKLGRFKICTEEAKLREQELPRVRREPWPVRRLRPRLTLRTTRLREGQELAPGHTAKAKLRIT